MMRHSLGFGPKLCPCLVLVPACTTSTLSPFHHTHLLLREKLCVDPGSSWLPWAKEQVMSQQVNLWSAFPPKASEKLKLVILSLQIKPYLSSHPSQNGETLSIYENVFSTCLAGYFLQPAFQLTLFPLITSIVVIWGCLLYTSHSAKHSPT